MKCFGCKNDKPRTEFDRNPALCRSCVNAPVYSNNHRSSKSGGSKGIGDAIGDFFEAIIDGITGN